MYESVIYNNLDTSFSLHNMQQLLTVCGNIYRHKNLLNTHDLFEPVLKQHAFCVALTSCFTSYFTELRAKMSWCVYRIMYRIFLWVLLVVETNVE